MIRIVEGPLNFIKQDHEEILTGDKPKDFIILKQYSYAEIKDPVIRNKEGKLVFDEHGQVKVRYGETEFRTDSQYPEPFPLYPGESLEKVDDLTVIPRDSALKVKANKDFVDSLGNKRQAGDEWLIKGPHIYIPRVEEEEIEMEEPIMLESNTALKIRAKNTFTDHNGKIRHPGEEWLIRTPGPYLLGVHEENVESVEGIILTNRKALHLIATNTFVDIYGQERRAGEEWLITKQIASVHICDVYEKVVAEIQLTTLRIDEHCYLLNPRRGNFNEMGKKILIRGPKSFFLQPGEVLEAGIKKNYLLADDEALLLTALEDFTEGEGKEAIQRISGARWMISGPISYVPPVQVRVVEIRKAIPLDKVEGVYIRNSNNGTIRAEVGRTYMLTEHEELAEKPCSDVVNELLLQQNHTKRTERYKLVTFKCPFNSAVQIYDYKKKKSRVVFGPDLVMLAPDEQFTVTYLSGSTPKKPGRVKTLYVLLGPNFSTDIAEVETSDHARLEIKLSFNWRFVLKPEQPELIFNVRDFIGDMCKAMASKVRSTIANIPFEVFHKSSVEVIRKAIFGYNKETEQMNELVTFESNGVEIFNVDIQSIEPVDKKTKESLAKTVTQAIQITTRIQEQEARRQADKAEQEEKGKLDCLVIDNKATVEKAKKAYLELKAQSDSIKSKGQAIAEAQAKAEAAELSAKAEVTFAEHKAKAKTVREKATIEFEKEKNGIDYLHRKALSDLTVKKAQELAAIECEKFKKIMAAIGADTLIEIANAGPEMQAKMLSSLGLQGYMMMGSENPINLFTTANGMIANEQERQPPS